MLSLLKYFRGYLRIRVSGFSPERFMNLCSNRDVLLWDIVQVEDAYEMYVSLQGFYKLKAIARKTRSKVVIIEKCGLPFLVPIMQKRCVFVGGLLLCMIFLYLSTFFVWDIEISGNYQITTNQFMHFLESQTVRTGMRKNQLDISTLEKEIRKTFTQITWTSVRLDGTKLLISVKENDAQILGQEEWNQTVTGTDLVSEYDGKIVSIVVRSGVPAVNIGDDVSAGDMLVDGKVPIYNDDGTIREYILTDADADIVIEHVSDHEIELPCEYIEREYTGRKKSQKFIRIGDGFEGKIPVESPYLICDRLMRQSRPALFEKLDIPIWTGAYVYREYQNVEHKYTQKQAEQLLEEKILLFLETLEEKGVQIIEKDVKIERSGNVWILNASLKVNEPAGKRVATDKGEQIIEE